MKYQVKAYFKHSIISLLSWLSTWFRIHPSQWCQIHWGSHCLRCGGSRLDGFPIWLALDLHGQQILSWWPIVHSHRFVPTSSMRGRLLIWIPIIRLKHCVFGNVQCSFEAGHQRNYVRVQECRTILFQAAHCLMPSMALGVWSTCLTGTLLVGTRM